MHRSLIAVLLGLLATAIAHYMRLPMPVPLLSLVILHITFERGMRAGFMCAGFVLITEVSTLSQRIDRDSVYRIIILCIAQPSMAFLLGSLKSQLDTINNELTGKLAFTADINRRYFDALMGSISMIGNYPIISMLGVDSEYIAVNEEFAYLYDLTEDEAIGKRWYVTVNPDDLDTAMHIYEEMIKTGCSRPTTVRGITKNGVSFDKEVVLIMCRDKDGRFIGYIKLEKKL